MVDARRHTGSANTDLGMAEFLRTAADHVDRCLSLHEHSTAVSRWASVLSRSLGHDAATTRRVALAGRLHDVGKIVIPDAVLGKPGELSTQEWDLLVRHPDHGARLVRVVPGFAAVAESIRQHHERVDGTGYPAGLQGTDIRVEARIIAVCDSWAAMRAARAYQAALPEDHAREQLRTGRGTQFAPDLVDLFLSLRDGGQIDDLALLG